MDKDTTERFIKEVERHPTLYVKSDPFFKCGATKSAIWANVGLEFGFSGSIAHRNFKSLREKYLRERKKTRTVWNYFEQMSFIDAFITERKSLSFESSVAVPKSRMKRSMEPDSELSTDTVSAANIQTKPSTQTKMNICRFCAKKDVEMMATACTPNSSIALLFEKVTNIKLSYSSAFPLNVCVICMAQLGIVDEILQKFRNIDEYWRTNRNDHKDSAAQPFALVIAENTLEEPEVKIELLEIETENSTDFFHDITKPEEINVTSKFIGLHIEKVESVVPELSSLYYCYVCEQSFPNAAGINRHRASNHKQPGPFTCNYCDMVFEKKKAIELHMASHTEFRCQYCSKLFQNSHRLHFHENRIHRYNDIVVCEECNKTFRSKYVLQSHIRYAHRNLTDHACKICGKVFPSLTRMQYHVNRHSWKRDKVCEFCPKAFFREGVLKIHMRSHTNERPYICEVCAKSFRTMSMLKLHFRRKHAPDSYAKKLKRNRNPFDYGPFKCDLCGCGYKCHQSLRNHFKSAHPYVHEAEWLKVSERICFSCNQIFASVDAEHKHQCTCEQRSLQSSSQQNLLLA